MIDIGSNSVRLVAYDGLGRAPVPMFNEKSLCGLGREVAVTGRLPEDGLEQARAALRRFRVLCDLMKVDELFVLATAAARRAENGPAFVSEVESILRAEVRVLTGQEEARLAAMGVLSGLHAPDGIAGDLGGGSLELVDIRDRAIGKAASLELGGLALRDASGRNLKKAARIVEDALAGLPFVAEGSGRDVFAIGGTWRAIARLYMAKTGYPLNVLHGFSVPSAAIAEFCQDLLKADIDTLPGIAEVARERRPLVPYGALVLEQVLAATRAARFQVSVSGVREGVLFDRLNAATRDSDPLLVGARALNDLHARDPRHADELIEWVERFAASLPDPGVIGSERIRKAACLVSEIAWRANPDYRAEEASRVVAYAALFALEHKERAFLASTMHARYEGLTENVAPPLRALLSLREIERARALGCLLRVAYNISAGRHGVLPETPIRMEEGRIVQILPAVYGDLSNERLVARLKQTAKVLGCGHSVQIRV